MESILNLPSFLVILGAGILLGAVVSAPLARRLAEPWIVVFGLAASLSLVAAATMSPGPAGIWGPCLPDMSRQLGLRELASNPNSSQALNTWLLIPVGVFVGYLAVRRWWLLLIAFAIPVGVEAVQRFVVLLSRRCEFQDIIDNTWGLVIGATVGVVLGYAVPRVSRSLGRSQ